MRSVLLAAALLLGAQPALAQPASPATVVTDQPVARAPVTPRAGLITGLDTNGLIAALVRAGFTAEAKTEAGQTYVLGKQGTTPFQVFLSNCQASGAGCTDIELYAGFTGGQRIAWERINGWNARTRFARAFLDEQRDPALQMDVSLQGGVSQDALKTSLTTWGSALETYALFLVARVPPVGAVAPPTVQPRAAQPKG